ncbi:MAG TPA: DUF5009 domain-containing protein [Planctomycetota bacterium]|nr:DUF5009 domain-containing protein [Planctomycetota bacterium]
MSQATTLTPPSQAAETAEGAPPASVPAQSSKKDVQRLVSLDAYRGFTMLLMASEGLHIPKVAKSFADSNLWQALAYQTDHVAWAGCALWDLIQPSFMFMVGVSMPYSLASRRAKGDSFAALFSHAIVRSLILIGIAIFLSSIGKKQTNFIFTNVLAQIGLGYPFLFLVAWLRPRWQFATAMGILIAYWAAFALYPLPGPDFDYAKVGVPKDWKYHFEGFAAHWNKNSNFASAFDQWFLNLFPCEAPFVFNRGGYATLNFIPALGTMIFGLLSGELLRSDREPLKKFTTLMLAGVAGLIVGFVLDVTGICPSVKRIWTPSWTIFSTGWTCLFLGAFYFIIDIKGWQRWAFAGVVVGMNSIAMYCLAQWPFRSFVGESLRIHLRKSTFELAGVAYAPIFEAAAVLFVLWAICWWMYRRKIFLRI